MKRLSILLAIVVLCIGFVATTQAATYTLYGQAVLSPTGPTGDTVFRLTSPPSGPAPYGYIGYTPTTPFALSGLTDLSADFKMVQGTFTGGTPRFDIGLDFNNDGVFDWTNDRYIMAYWGTQPWGGGTPPTGWTNTGNFMDTSIWGAVTFLDGNTQYTAAGLKAAFGTLNVMEAYVSVDSGWSAGTQILDVNNFRVNGDVYSAAPVPIPGALVLFGSGLLGLVGIGRKRLRK